MANPMNRGALELAAVIARDKLSQGDIMRRIGAPHGSICRWLDAQRKPGTHFAGLLQAAYGIDVTWWSEVVPGTPRKMRRRGRAAKGRGSSVRGLNTETKLNARNAERSAEAGK